MTDHAVVIGINDYPGLSSLGGPCNDAQEFIKWVEKPGPGNLDPQHVHKLLSTDFPPSSTINNAQPSSADIEGVFNQLLNGNPTSQIGDRLYIFVAGHGMSDINSSNSTALIAANATLTGLTLPHVVVTKFVHFFKKSYTFKEIILIMDCCRDANVLRPLNDPGLLQTPVHPNAKNVRLFLANATVWSQKSFEKDFNGTTRGIFSVTLMEALAKAPATGGKVTGQIIKHYIEEHIRTIAEDVDIDEPDINGTGHEKIVFYQRNDSQLLQTANAFKVKVNVTNTNNSEIVQLFDGNRKLVESKTAVSGFVEFQVPAGIYKILIENTNRSLLLEVVTDNEKTI